MHDGEEPPAEQLDAAGRPARWAQEWPPPAQDSLGVGAGSRRPALPERGSGSDSSGHSRYASCARFSAEASRADGLRARPPVPIVGKRSAGMSCPRKSEPVRRIVSGNAMFEKTFGPTFSVETARANQIGRNAAKTCDRDNVNAMLYPMPRGDTRRVEHRRTGR
jgi:hypothetical protein